MIIKFILSYLILSYLIDNLNKYMIWVFNLLLKKITYEWLDYYLS